MVGGHVIVVDLGYGDAGKGMVVDWLCATRPVHTVVRFNGGAQAGHNVIQPDRRHHTFAQFGSGTFHGVPTHLSRYMVVDPLALVAEADHLATVGVPAPLGLLTVDRDALLATPYHRAANRAREIARGGDRHGSCGMGVGETMRYALTHPADAPRAGDCLDAPVLRRRLTALRARLSTVVKAAGPLPPSVDEVMATFQAFAAQISIVDGRALLGRALRAGLVVFEGAQGVLLDEWHGFHPYTTWSTTTFANAEELLGEAGASGYRLGVLRTFTTRHGPGPLVTEDPAVPLTDPYNPANPWQGRFRVGHFDAVAHRYAVDVVGGVDGVALTHLDTAVHHPELRLCDRYDDARLVPGPPGDLDRQERLTRRLLTARPVYRGTPTDWVAAVEEHLSVPVVLTSTGPTASDKRTCRPWTYSTHAGRFSQSGGAHLRAARPDAWGLATPTTALWPHPTPSIRARPCDHSQRGSVTVRITRSAATCALTVGATHGSEGGPCPQVRLRNVTSRMRHERIPRSLGGPPQ